MSISAEGKFQYPTGRAGAEALGYDPLLLKDVDVVLMNSFCGVGNPFSIGIILAYFILKKNELRKIMTVLNAKLYDLQPEEIKSRL